MDFIKQNKLLAAGALVAVLAVVYYFFFTTPSTPPLTETNIDSPVSQELLVTLSNLRSIDLSGAIFSDPVFVSLTDFGVTIPLEPVGRRNPFAPFVGSVNQNTFLTLPSTR